ncbi:unnamed protein product [Parnassius mnemosyne]|uniref:Uncharacterized protein n=1 Tax=Parnassius mnemosyne TaxID=213953 RepID=A0AAV1LE65_9NEOP
MRIEQVDEARRVSTTREVDLETCDSEPIASQPVHESLEMPSEVVSSNITLENYRRAANTASHCLFPQCTNINLHNMADSFRAQYSVHINIISQCTAVSVRNIA